MDCRARRPIVSNSLSLPLVGVTACRQPGKEHPEHRVGEKYVACIPAAVGAVPLVIPSLGTKRFCGAVHIWPLYSDSENAMLREDLDDHSQRERILKDTLLSAQKVSEDVRANARKEAELIVKDAELLSDRLMSQAQSRMADLVSEDSQARHLVAALDFEHLRELQLREPRMREIERNGDAGHAVGREPFV